ncbi:hypothetical protein IWX75_000234 [Arthrobacter sp. CAN_A6]
MLDALGQALEPPPCDETPTPGGPELPLPVAPGIKEPTA